ncbi:MAG: MoaD/ThiS family protein [Candidatus Limnocylindrales bacterium]
MPTVVLPRSLADLFPGMPRRVGLEGGASVSEVIDELERRWPGVRDRLCDPGPVLREYINVYVDGEPARIDTPVAAGATVHVLPAVAGG